MEDDKAATEEIQAWMAMEICVLNQLQTRSKELLADVQSSERLHIQDLLTTSITKGSLLEEELEIAYEQIASLKQQLYNLNMELRCAHDMVDFYGQQLNNFYSTGVENEKKTNAEPEPTYMSTIMRLLDV